MNGLTCKEAQSMIREYITGKLSGRDLERFIGHVRECRECYDELETFFMIDRAVRYLDEDTLHTFNLKSLLEKDLKEKERAVARRKRRRWLFAALTGVTALLTALMLLDVFGIFQVSRWF